METVAEVGVNQKAIEFIKGIRKVLNGGKNWIKGQEKDLNNNFCLVGAAAEVGNPMHICSCTMCLGSLHQEFSDDPVVIAYKAMKRFIPKSFNSITGFNDNANTTWKDVDSVLKKSILYLGG